MAKGNRGGKVSSSGKVAGGSSSGIKSSSKKTTSPFDKWTDITEEFRETLKDAERSAVDLGLKKQDVYDAANVSFVNPIRISDYSADVWEKSRLDTERLYVKVLMQKTDLAQKKLIKEGKTDKYRAEKTVREHKKYLWKEVEEMDDTKLRHSVNLFIQMGAILPLKRDEQKKYVYMPDNQKRTKQRGE